MDNGRKPAREVLIAEHDLLLGGLIVLIGLASFTIGYGLGRDIGLACLLSVQRLLGSQGSPDPPFRRGRGAGRASADPERRG
jgi:hypothetical protein